MITASAERLTTLVTAIFEHAGSMPAEARAIADNLVEANLQGHDSHGIGMTPRYIGHWQRDALALNQHVTVLSDNGPVLQLDGNLGYGQVIGREAMDLGIAKTRETGVAIVALRNSHHLGRIGAWGEMCADAGYVSIHYVNVQGHRPLVAPFGGAEARYATNPYCTAFPATKDHPPIVFDMATSQIAGGKVRVAYNKGEKLKAKLLIDADGRPTDDPGVMFEEPRGALTAIGEHKGYGLALVCEMLAGALVNGGTCLPERGGANTIVNNMLSIILDPAMIGDPDVYERERAAMTAYVKAARPATGVDAVLVPGDPERRSVSERSAKGIPVDDRTWEQMLESAATVGMSEADVNAIMFTNAEVA